MRITDLAYGDKTVFVVLVGLGVPYIICEQLYANEIYIYSWFFSLSFTLRINDKDTSQTKFFIL